MRMRHAVLVDDFIPEDVSLEGEEMRTRSRKTSGRNQCYDDFTSLSINLLSTMDPSQMSVVREVKLQ